MIYGSVINNQKFSEKTNIIQKPYSASKASSDHIVRSWANTYELPTIITNCSNNTAHISSENHSVTILNILDNKKIPVYGDGQQIRD